jgi:hypothetical protein
MKKPKLNNADASMKLAKKAKTALIKGISRDWTAAKTAATEAAKLELKCLNSLRSAGLKVQQACGHEQVGFEFVRGIEKQLPEGCHFKALKFCVHLARQFGSPIQTLDEARAARQMMFEALGETTASKRMEAQRSHENNPWSEFVSASSGLLSLFGKMDIEAMDKWGKDKVATFVRETEPIAEAHSRAKGLLK